MIKNENSVTVGVLLFPLAVFASCGQNQTYACPDRIRSASKNTVSFYGPTRMVWHVEQARNGDILIASCIGVWHYNVKLFTNLTGAIPSPGFWDAVENRKGIFWFGINDLRHYAPSATLRTNPNTISKVSQEGASARIEDTRGNIRTTGAANTNGFGVWKHLPNDQKTLYNEKPTVTKIRSTEKMLCRILEANEGSTWFGSMNGRVSV